MPENNVFNPPNGTSPTDANLTLTDVTTNNASTTKHGFLKKLSGTATEYMDGSGAWSTPTGLSAATQAQQEAASSTVVAVTPGRQQYHPSAAKAWGKADFAGALAIGYNISSVTDVGTGIIGWNFTTAFSSAVFSVTASSETNGISTCYNTLAVGSVRTTSTNTLSQTAQDATSASMQAFGDQ